MAFDFKNKNVLITGGSRGIGRAIALQFARYGARVAIHFNSNKKAAEDTLEQLPAAFGAEHFALSADLADAEAVEKIAAAVIDEMERVDVLVNNAGIYVAHDIEAVSYSEWQAAWQQTMAVNLFGPANLTYLIATQMMRRGGGGKIINVTSRGAFRGEPDHPAYGASKAAMNAFTQSLALKLGAYQIQVAAVAPGFVETDMTEEILKSAAGDAIRRQSPLNRVATPEEVAYTVLFLASEGAAFSTGAIIDVNGASYLRS